MKENKFRSYEEYEWMELEKYFTNKQGEMNRMSKFYDYDAFDKYEERKNKCHDKKHHHCDEKDEIFYCKCKKVDHGYDYGHKHDHCDRHEHSCKHEHKHYHKHEYKHDSKDDHKKDANRCKKEKRKRKDKADMVDFVYAVKEPRNEYSSTGGQLVPDTDNVVATLTLEEVFKGDVAWLNGVVGLDNDNSNVVRLEIKIIKGNVMMGETVYRSVIEIDDNTAGDDDRSIEPFMHVDKIDDFDEDVQYTLVLRPNRSNLRLAGPVTFTATQIDKKRGY